MEKEVIVNEKHKRSANLKITESFKEKSIQEMHKNTTSALMK